MTNTTALLITGSHGQLGRSLLGLAADRGLATVGHDVDTLDITDADAVSALVGEVRPQAVVNCAAYTAVDGCEEEESLARRINRDGVAILAAACNGVDATLVHVSTDYVFPGDGLRPYREDDPTGPVSAYGRTKLEGEQAARTARRHLIARTAWLYGHGGANFVEAIRRQIDSSAEVLRVVADQQGCPTYSDDLATALLDLVACDARGVVHTVNTGVTTWHGFATEIARLLGAEIEIEAVTTEAFARPAPRPAYSVLDTSRLEALTGRAMPPWEDGLRRYLERACAS
jgi:dTDP-4-dehydrorhamnose reductase